MVRLSKNQCRLALALALVVSLGCFSAGIWNAVEPLIGTVSAAAQTANWQLITLVVIASFTYRLLNAGVWGVILAAIGQPIGRRIAARMWLLSEACRWLPGSVWSYGSRIVLASRIRIPAATVGSGLALELLLTIGSWLAVGMMMAAVGGIRVEMPDTLPTMGTIIIGIAFGFTAVVALSMNRRVRVKVQGVLLRLRHLANQRFRPRFACGAFLAYTFLGMFNGFTCWLIVRALSPEADVPMAPVIAANAIAWLVGFLAIFAPAGLGVREGTFVILLSPWISWELAAVVAAFWRLIQIGTEVACVGLAAVNGANGFAPDPLPVCEIDLAA